MAFTPSGQREQQLAALAHSALYLSFLPLLGLVLGSGAMNVLVFFIAIGPAVAYIIWRKNRLVDDWLAIQSLQALLFQVPLLILAYFFGLWLLGFMGLLYATWAAIRTYRGASFKYIIAGGLAESFHLRTTRRG